MNLSVIFDLIFSVQLSKPAIECVNEFFSQLGQRQLYPVLLAFDKNNPVFQVEELNSTVVVINENYNVHYGLTILRVHSALIFIGCPYKNSSILWTIKKNRLISVEMKLLLVVDVRCRSPQAPEDYLEEIKRTLSPACSAVIAYNGVQEDFHWAWSHGVKSQTSHSGAIDPKQCQVEIPEVRQFIGHDLKFSAAAQDPYVLKQNTAGEPQEGLEIKIIHNIAEAIGMKLIWVPLPPDEPARLLQNAKNDYIGMFGVLYRLESDITFGGIIPLTGRFHAAELIMSHTYDELAWLIPAAPEANNLGAVFSVFSLTIWMLVGSSVLLFTVLFSFGRFRKLPRNFLKVLGAVLDQSIRIESHRQLLFWLLYVLYCLIITNAYRSGLITALTSKKEGRWFETPEDAVDAGEKTYIMPSGLPQYTATAVDDPMWQTILEPDRHIFIQDYSFLKNISDSRHGLVLCIANTCEYSIYKNNLLRRDLKERVTFLKKRYLLFPVTMFMAPGSVLQPVVNMRTLWLDEAGFFDYWLDEIEWRTLLTAMFDDTDGHYYSEPKKLSMLHLQSTFYMYVSFLLLSVGVFFIELSFNGKNDNSESQ